MNDEEKEIVAKLLQISREKIAEGNGQDALSAILNAVRFNSGEDSIIRILGEAQRRVTKENEKALREATYQCCKDLVSQPTLLAEMGDEDILLDAFQDGSSVICQKCGGLVPVDRAEAHSKYWCSANPSTENDSEED